MFLEAEEMSRPNTYQQVILLQRDTSIHVSQSQHDTRDKKRNLPPGIIWFHDVTQVVAFTS